MKKFTLFAATALAAATVASAATIGNPADPAHEGQYIVAYDLANGKWCEANPEIDETFVFAIDFTGTGLEDAMKTIPSPNRKNILGRSGAFDIFNQNNLNADDETATAKADGRLFPIDRDKNIYGMTTNLFQLMVSRTSDMAFGPDANFEHYAVCTEGTTFQFGDNVFAFGWDATNPGAEWWDGVGAPVQDVLVWTMAPYTGTKTGTEFSWGELHGADTECALPGLDLGAWNSMVANWGGYALPSDYAGLAAIETVASDLNAEVVATEYFDIMGRRVNGVLENGVTIRREMLANGKTNVTKLAR